MTARKSSKLAQAIDLLKSAVEKLTDFNENEIEPLVRDSEHLKRLQPTINKLRELFPDDETADQTPLPEQPTKTRKRRDKSTDQNTTDQTDSGPGPDQDPADQTPADQVTGPDPRD